MVIVKRMLIAYSMKRKSTVCILLFSQFVSLDLQCQKKRIQRGLDNGMGNEQRDKGDLG